MTVLSRIPFLEDYDVVHVPIPHSDRRMRVLDELVEDVEAHNLIYGPQAPLPPDLVRRAAKLGADLNHQPRDRHHCGPGSILHDALMELASDWHPGTTEPGE